MFSSRRISVSGSPVTAMMSAYLPGLMEPNVGVAEQVGGVAGGGLNGLHRRHAVFHHEGELFCAGAVGADAGVGAEGHFRTGGNGFAEIVALGLTRSASCLR